ncbi:hypothetical protein [Sphingomonas sp.]|uniref:hypothetical protein n=1 Tax=Sphingomonas sp. TaxID=28214 RepID=UPI003D6CF89D
MKLLPAICATALAMANIQAASATTYTPAGTYVFQGLVNTVKGFTLTCILTVTITVPESAPDADGTASHGHNATATPILSAGNALCPVQMFSGAPYPVSFDGATISLNGVGYRAFGPGDCTGTLSGQWNGNIATPRTITFNTSLPGDGGTAPCRFIGNLNQVSGTALSITNP